MNVAIVHDYLLQRGGAEKVVEVLHDMYPAAPIFTLAFDPTAMPTHYSEWDIRPSFVQKYIHKGKRQRYALPFYPMAIESFDLREYDVVISSASSFAKGVITQPETQHICYMYTPTRFLWMEHEYMENENVPAIARPLLRPMLHYLRGWDLSAVQRVDTLVAISNTVSRRIEKFYRRDSNIIYPPVETTRFSVESRIDDYYLIVSRLVPYKKLELAIRAFNRLGIKLKIAGRGRQMEELKAVAKQNIEFLGFVSDADLPELVAHSRGFILPGVEDFCIAQVEANACGRPVIAFAGGGALDTQVDGHTGVLFYEQTVDAICDAVCRAEEIDFDPYLIQKHARRYDTRVFKEEFGRVVAGLAPSELDAGGMSLGTASSMLHESRKSAVG